MVISVGAILMANPKPEKSQLDKFRDAARELVTDDDPEQLAPPSQCPRPARWKAVVWS